MLFAPGVDDRGRPIRITLSDPRDVAPGSALDDGRLIVLIAMRVAIDAVRSRAGWYIATMMLLLVLDCLALWIAGPLAMFLVLSSPIGSIVLVLLVNAGLGVARVLDERKRRARELWLAAGRCPCCGYSINTSSEGDASLPCAECGSAWRPLEPGEERIVVSRIRPEGGFQALA